MTGPARAGRALPLLLGATAAGVLVQSALASVFLQGGSRGRWAGWVFAHGVGADVVTALALVALVVATRTHRPRRVVLATGSVFALLLAESLLGHLINGSIGGTDHDRLTLVHIPLGVALMGATVWLAGDAVRLGRENAVLRAAGSQVVAAPTPDAARSVDVSGRRTGDQQGDLP